jgi:cell division protein FtsN
MEAHIESIQKEVTMLHQAILSSADPKETASLKQELAKLTNEVVDLRGKLLNLEQTRGSTAMAAATNTATTTPAAATPKPAPEKTEEPATAKPAAEQATSPATASSEPAEEPETPAEEPTTAAAAADSSSEPEAASEPKPAPASAGEWGINLRSYATQALAEKGQQQLTANNLDTVIREAVVSGKTWYRLRVEGFNSSAAAKRFISDQLADKGFSGAWISRNQ